MNINVKRLAAEIKEADLVRIFNPDGSTQIIRNKSDFPGHRLNVDRIAVEIAGWMEHGIINGYEVVKGGDVVVKR